jgi:hypothetical protein
MSNGAAAGNLPGQAAHEAPPCQHAAAAPQLQLQLQLQFRSSRRSRLRWALLLLVLLIFYTFRWRLAQVDPVKLVTVLPELGFWLAQA